MLTARSAKVLVVDDSSAIRKILRRVLSQVDYPIDEVFEAADGVEALGILGSQKITVVLSDVNMPNMDGFQLLTEIKSRTEWKCMPVIMITTEGSQNRVMEAVGLGASGYIRKPFTAQEIKEKLEAALSATP